MLVVASLLNCLHQLRQENNRLEELVTNLSARRDHLLVVNARLQHPHAPLNNTQGAAAGGGGQGAGGTPGAAAGGGTPTQTGVSPDAANRHARINNILPPSTASDTPSQVLKCAVYMYCSRQAACATVCITLNYM